MNKNNKLIIAAAGSGKTTHIVEEALTKKEDNVLITTFTVANEQEIRNKIIKKIKYIPKNITIQTWFSFLLQHGVRPYQGIMSDNLFNKKIGFYLIEGKSGCRYKIRGIPVYWGETDFENYYFTNDLKIYSDKISKFVFECNKKSDNEIINRLARIYPYMFIDEVQDLAGWDLELIKLFLQSPSKTTMVGDPRQGTYSTNDSLKYAKYKGGKIKDFIENECPKSICEIDEDTLNTSHRNNEMICKFSSMLYTEFSACKPCTCKQCKNNIPDHQGLFIIKNTDVKDYCEKYKPVKILRYSEAKFPDLNYGASKGLSFDRVLIYPTGKILEYLKNGDAAVIETVKAKFYVAVTRAKYSVAIVCDYGNDEYIEGITKYQSE